MSAKIFSSITYRNNITWEIHFCLTIFFFIYRKPKASGFAGFDTGLGEANRATQPKPRPKYSVLLNPSASSKGYFAKRTLLRIQVTLTCCLSLFKIDQPKGYGNNKAQAQKTCLIQACRPSALCVP
jgi:hypothetical protein